MTKKDSVHTQAILIVQFGDKKIKRFFCQKNCQLKKMSSIPQQYFFNHSCQQCSHNLRLPDCFQKFYTIFFTKNLSGTWVLTYNSSDGKIAKEKFQRLKIHATQETKKLPRIYGKISEWQNHFIEKLPTRGQGLRKSL